MNHRIWGGIKFESVLGVSGVVSVSSRQFDNPLMVMFANHRHHYVRPRTTGLALSQTPVVGITFYSISRFTERTYFQRYHFGLMVFNKARCLKQDISRLPKESAMLAHESVLLLFSLMEDWGDGE